MFEHSLSLLAYLLTSLLVYTLSKWIYRMTFHPLAKFPGPTKAAISTTYAMSHDLPVATSYVKEFPSLHERYGPIVRIEPNHLHIHDIDAYNQVFKMGTKCSKDPGIYSFIFTQGSFFNKLTVKEAKPHKDMYTTAFSKSAVQSLEPVIKQNLALFLRTVDMHASKKTSIDFTRAFRCLNADTIMRYCFDTPFKALEAPDFKFPLLEAFEEFFDRTPDGWYFPKTVNAVVEKLSQLPRAWIQGNKGIAAALSMIDGCRERIVTLKQESKEKISKTVLRASLNPNIGKGQPKLNEDQLTADALVFFTAGTDTTANTLTRAIWGLLNDRPTLAKLQAELKAAIPYHEDLTQMDVGWVELEKLEILHCVIKEALRVSYGVPGKLPRVIPAEGMTLCGQYIPPGTTVSMSCYVYHHDSNVFEDPYKFKPDRWLAGEDKVAEMDRYFMPFSRGSRACMGSNLAYAQLHYTLTYLLRNFDLELFETTERDMEWHDSFVMATFGHLKVKATRLTS